MPSRRTLRNRATRRRGVKRWPRRRRPKRRRSRAHAALGPVGQTPRQGRAFCEDDPSMMTRLFGFGEGAGLGWGWLGLVVSLEPLDLLDELADVLELPVDGREPDVGDRIEALEMVHDHAPELFAA